LIQTLQVETDFMKRLILLALVCTGFAVTTPLTAQALDSEKIAQYVGEASPLENRDQNRNDRDRNGRDREEQHHDSEDRPYRTGDRLFVVYYRSSDDRKWMYVSKHYSRRAAERAANRLERRGYRIQIL
jgi:Ni/Co efflux regulator RcnB